jgi:hypothetical protein
MQYRVREQPMRTVHILFDKRVVCGAALAGTAVTHIERVLQQLLVVGPDIQRHRDRAARIDTGSSGMQRQLANRDLDAAHHPVAHAQNRFGVGAYDQVDIVGAQAQRLEGFGNAIGAINGQIQSTLCTVLVGETLDRFAHRGRVHDRHSSRR